MSVLINGVEQATYLDSDAIAAVEGEATLALAGDVDVATGKTLSADGLLFPDTQVASADANELDDYEEGTFTPGIGDDSGDGSGESQVYTTQIGRYTKIGNRVFFYIRVLISDLGGLTTSQGAIVTGLPFTSLSTTGTDSPVYVGRLVSAALPNASETPTGIIGPNSKNLFMQNWDVTTGTSNLLVSELSVDADIILGGAYEV